MDYMPGTTLEKAWESFNHDQKVMATTELGAYVSQLRQLKGSYIGAANRGKAVVGRRDRTHCGPFDSETQFNKYLLSRIVSKAAVTLREYATACVQDNHEIVFTHGDLMPWNILVDAQGHITAILDWEDAGWYPAYWEYYRALRTMKPVDGWADYFRYILPYDYKWEVIGMSYLNMISYS